MGTGFSLHHRHADPLEVQAIGMNWLKRAACLGSSTETFFEEDRSLEAIAICQLCPVKSDCFEYAIKHEDYGVWGATTEEERRASEPPLA